MNIAGIVAEYNPLHRGHQYQLQQARLQADYVIVAMSGAFVQRGEPAAYDKWMRCRWALEAGADLVLELPAVYALQSARGFALGAVHTLAEAGCNMLSFGTESDDIQALTEAASLINSEGSDFQAALKVELKRGKSYPRARHDALEAVGEGRPEVIACLKHPNFLLAAEYIRAMEDLPRPMEILPVIRRGEGHDANLQPQQGEDEEAEKGIALREAHYASASRIRAMAKIQQDNPQLSYYLPASVWQELRHYPPAQLGNLENILLYKLRSSNGEDLAGLFGADEGLDQLLTRAAALSSLDEVLACCKSKRYTLARIRRLLCAAMLDITADLVGQANGEGPSYLRVLGYRRESSFLLNRMAESSLPMVLRKRDFMALTGTGEESIVLDIRAANLQALAFPDTPRRTAGRDFTERVLVLEDGVG